MMLRLKAVFASFAIHVGLTILVAMILTGAGVTESLPPILIAYMFLGWIPLAIWGYPFLRNRMK